MTKWQYKSIRFETHGFSGGILETVDFDLVLNEMGEQGWELATVLTTSHKQGTTRYIVATFKRPM